MSDEEKERLIDSYKLGAVTEGLRVPIFPTLEHCFMFVAYLAAQEDCKMLQELITWMLRRIRADKDEIPLDDYIDKDSMRLFDELIDRAKTYNDENVDLDTLRSTNRILREQVEGISEQRNNLLERLNKIRDILDHDADYDSSDFESRKFQNDIRRVIDE